MQDYQELYNTSLTGLEEAIANSQTNTVDGVDQEEEIAWLFLLAYYKYPFVDIGRVRKAFKCIDRSVLIPEKEEEQADVEGN